MVQIKSGKQKNQLQKIYEVTTPSQFLWMLVSGILLMHFPNIIESANTYSRYRRLERPDFDLEKLEDFWMVIPCFIFLKILKFAVNSTWTNFLISKLGKKYSGEDLEQKVTKWCKGIFKVIFFSLTFYVGLFHVLNKTNFSPPLMFGDGTQLKTFGDWPFTPKPAMFRIYYMLSMAYYIEDWLVHLVQTPKFDYWEMILHHIVTIMLIYGSYMNGFWILGVYVLPQMDISDIFIGLIRSVMDFVPGMVTFLIWWCIMISWIYFRFLCFVQIVIMSWCFAARLSADNDVVLCSYNSVLLCSLLGLNIYWFILLVNMGLNFVIKKEAVDTQAVLNLNKKKS